MPEATQTPTPTITTEAPAANTPQARSPTGEILDATQTPATTTSDGQATSSDSTTSEAEAKPEPKAPDAYTDFKLPDGYKLEPTVLAEVTPIFKDLNLTQDQAQRLVNAHTKMVAADAKNYADMRKGWLADLAKDRDIGTKLDDVKLSIGQALNHLNDPELVESAREALAFTGAGDHPAVVKAFYKLAQLVNEGRPVTGANPSPLGQTPNGQATRRTAAQSLYPNLPS